ncbi:MAG: Crp/Fnr family transcriptional regulator [Caldilineaceae bacterium]|nr:Crp/Fnr family transcriptional regulator [Caldilineaceae bacterium]
MEGDTAPGFYFIEHGWIKIVTISTEGREQILYIWGPGDLFGGVTAFVDQPAPATAIALEATGLWLLPRHALHEHLLREPTFALRLIEFMAQRLSEMITLVSDLSLRSLTARLARRLLENAVDDVVQRQRWATQAEMSARLAAAPDVVNRALRALVEDGIIELSRQQIRIVDRQRLQVLAASER